MRESRNDLRPVSIPHYHRDTELGYLHCFVSGNSERSMDVCAIVELEDGSVRTVNATEITFDDVESEEEEK